MTRALAFASREPRTLSGHRMLSEDAVRFRRALIDALVVDGAPGYVTENSFGGHCPVCGEYLNFRFHGFAPRADLHCHGGCTEREVAEALGLGLREESS
jgi:hypothetical protein